MAGERARAVDAVVLAGGRSERFGSDKASALLAGRPLLAWVVEAIAGACDGIIVVRATGQVLPALADGVRVTVVEDRHPGMGPLAGMIAGFEASRAELCLVVTCDAPLIAGAVADVLVNALDDKDAAVPLIAGRAQPLLAVYRRETALPVLVGAMEAGTLSVNAATRDVRTVRPVEEDFAVADPAMLSFRNCNTREELAALESLLAQ